MPSSHVSDSFRPSSFQRTFRQMNSLGVYSAQGALGLRRDIRARGFNHSGLRVIRSTGVHRIQNFALAVYIAFSGVEGQSFLA